MSRTARGTETVYPGQDSTVTLKILIPRRRNKAALDLLDKGIEFYQKGYEQNYRQAAGLFEQALQMDPTYSQAAFYLGLTYNALFDEDKAAQYYQESHRDRSRLSGSPRQLWRHAARHGQRG